MAVLSSVMCQNTSEAFWGSQHFGPMLDTWAKSQNTSIALKLNLVVGAPAANSKTEHRVIVLYSCLMRIHIDGRYS